MVGDLVKIKEGDEIPADGMLIEGENLKIDESKLTGENVLRSKDTFAKCCIALESKTKEAQKAGGPIHFEEIPSPILLSGTTVDISYESFASF